MQTINKYFLVRTLIAAWCIGLPVWILAEDHLITPEQIVSRTLAHSYQLKAATKEIAAAEAKQAETRAQALPQLTTDVRAMRYTGLYDSAFGPFFLIPAIDSRYNAGVSLSQPAYTGGRISNQKEGAYFQKRAAEEIRRGNEADFTLQALAAYWNWSKVYYSLEALKAAVTRMEAHARDINNLYQAGLATDNDTLATEVLLDQTRLRLDEAKRGIEMARARIAFLSGQELPQESEPSKYEAQGESIRPPETELLTTAKTNRAEPAARQWELKAAEAQVKVSRAEYYPQVALTARYEQARPNLLNIPPVDKWQDDGFAGIALSWNIFDWSLTRARVAQATARSAQAKLRLDQVQEDIVLQVREANIDLQNVKARVTVAERVESSARRNLAATTDLWQNGLARHSELLDAHAQFTNAQSEVIAAKADLAIAQAALQHAIGLLGHTGKAAK